MLLGDDEFGLGKQGECSGETCRVVLDIYETMIAGCIGCGGAFP